MSDFHLEVYKLTKALEENQYKPRDVSKLIPKCDILTREKLQKIPVDKSKAYSSTSGSTGEPVYVQKFYLQQLWYNATNIRELLWLKWDPSKTLAIVNAPVSKEESYPWITNPYMFGSNVGKCITHPLRGDIQGWLDKNKPEYLHSYPSVIKTLDTSKLLGVKSTGENGSTAYTSEELGTIAITCPDNPDVYHVMENIVLEIDDDKNIIATDLTHPYLKRYKIGDKGEFGTCSCGRTLQTLNKNVIGRVRNMMKLPDGSSVWPLFGSNSIRNVCDTIKRFQCVQESYTDVTLKIQGIIPEDKYEEIKALVRNRLQHPFTVNIQVIDNFPDSKFEEFVCKINENPS